MRVVVRVAVLVVVLGGAWYAVRSHYADRKLDALAPQALEARVTWSGTGPRLLLVGDSRIAEWPTDVPHGWRVGRIGFAGATARNITRAATPLLEDLDPDVALVSAGTNDATAAVFQHGTEREATLRLAVESLLDLADAARRAGACRVIVLTTAPPIGLELHKRLLMGSAQDRLMRDLARRQVLAAREHGLEVIDAGRLLGDDRRFRRDSLHWTPAAYDRLAEQLPLPSDC